MYRYTKPIKTSLNVNNTIEGETIEQKVRRITVNKEAIKDGAPEIFTERKEGVKAGYNIRTDRFEIATEAMDAVNRSIIAKRENKPKMEVIKNDDIDKVEPTQGTETK